MITKKIFPLAATILIIAAASGAQAMLEQGACDALKTLKIQTATFSEINWNQYAAVEKIVFKKEVPLNAKEFAQLTKLLKKLNTFKFNGFFSSVWNPEGLEELKKFKKITRITLTKDAVKSSPNLLKDIQNICSRCPKLTHLTLGGFKNNNIESALEKIPGLTSLLTSLKESESTKCMGLDHLQIVRLGITDEQLETLLTWYMAHAKRPLKKLSLTSCRALKQPTGDYWKAFKDLEELDIADTDITMPTIQAILKELPAIKRLTITGALAFLDEKEIKKFDWHLLKNMEDFDAKWTTLDLADLAKLLEACPKLTKINLKNNCNALGGLGDKGVIDRGELVESIVNRKHREIIMNESTTHRLPGCIMRISQFVINACYTLLKKGTSESKKTPVSRDTEEITAHLAALITNNLSKMMPAKKV